MQKYLKFLNVAKAISELSKDPSTKVGAVLIGPDREGGPWGYNGAPRGCSADEDERYETREERLAWVTHAEANALLAAARSGFRTSGCTMVVTHTPCMNCAKSIVQAGIHRVVFPSPDPEFAKRWAEDMSRSRRLFHECGVDVVEIDHKNTKLIGAESTESNRSMEPRRQQKPR